MKALLAALALILCSCDSREEGGPAGPPAIAPHPPLAPALALSIEVYGLAWIRKVVEFKVRIKNVSDREVDVVSCLDGSDVGWRFPRFIVKLWGPDGKPVNRSLGRCGNCNGLGKADVVSLKPNEEFDPLGPGTLGHHTLTQWTPAVVGKYRLTLTVDYSAHDPAEWNGPEERVTVDGEKVRKLLACVPREKMESTLEFEVTD